MSLNLYRYLEDLDIKDNYHALALAFLQNKGLRIQGTIPREDRKWNFGQYEGVQLIKTDDNSVFVFRAWPEIKNYDFAKQHQTVGSSLHEQFVNTISYFIAKGYRQLPANNIKIAICLNHNDAHWTSLLAHFEGLESKQYLALYKAYQHHANQTNENRLADGSLKPQETLVNNVREFLVAQKGITFNRRTKDKAQTFEMSNWRLPIAAQNISITQYDSLSSLPSSSSDSIGSESCKEFVKVNNVKMVPHQGITSQSGMTCGDWSCFNVFQYGVLAKPTPQRKSEDLRFFSENLSIENAHEMLHSQDPKLIHVKKKDRICVTQDGRAMDPQGLEILFVFFSNMFNKAATLLCYLQVRIFGESKIAGLSWDSETGRPAIHSTQVSTGIVDYPYRSSLPELEQKIDGLLKAKEKVISYTETAEKSRESKRKTLIPYYAKQMVAAHPRYFDSQAIRTTHDENYVDMAKANKLVNH